MRTTIIAVTLLVASPAVAQIFDSGSTGALGALLPTEDVEVALPPTGVLHYTEVDIPAGVTVTFLRNADNTPVVMLASGDVTIEGVIDVSGKPQTTVYGWLITHQGGEGGPGASDGGSTRVGPFAIQGAQSGMGPAPGVGTLNTGYQSASGGASPVNWGGKKAQGPVNPQAPSKPEYWQLHGGSGGGSGVKSGGTGGGGAITIAASGTLTLNGVVKATNGTGELLSFGGGLGSCGGAGSVRLVATEVIGAGDVDARGDISCAFDATFGSPGGDGVIRIEGYQILGDITTGCCTDVTPTYGLPQPAIPFPANQQPRLRIIDVDGQAPSYDKYRNPATEPELTLGQSTTATVTVEAKYVPLGTVVTVIANTVGKGYTTWETTPLAGTFELSTATADVPIPNGTRLGALQAWIQTLPVP